MRETGWKERHRRKREREKKRMREREDARDRETRWLEDKREIVRVEI